MISLYLLFFIGGMITALTFRADIMPFLTWIKHSWEEQDGRASGKALASFLFSIILCIIAIRIINRPPELQDFKENQVVLIKVVIENLVYLIICLYLLKNFAKSTVISTFLSRFTKGGDNNGNNNTSSNNNSTPGATPGSTPTP